MLPNFVLQESQCLLRYTQSTLQPPALGLCIHSCHLGAASLPSGSWRYVGFKGWVACPVPGTRHPEPQLPPPGPEGHRATSPGHGRVWRVHPVPRAGGLHVSRGVPIIISPLKLPCLLLWMRMKRMSLPLGQGSARGSCNHTAASSTVEARGAYIVLLIRSTLSLHGHAPQSSIQYR